MRGLTDAGLSAAAVYLVATLLFLPYTRAYELFYSGIDPSPAKTSVQHYLVIWGFFLFCCISVLMWSIINSPETSFLAAKCWSERLARSRKADRRRSLLWVLGQTLPLGRRFCPTGCLRYSLFPLWPWRSSSFSWRF